MVKHRDKYWRLGFHESIVALVKRMIVAFLELVVVHKELLSPVSVLLAEVCVEDVVVPREPVHFVFVAH